jgi:membrane protease YdiL (CAAX protease family)
LALVAFLVFAVTDFAGLAVGPTMVVPGIQGIRSGKTVNSAMDYNGNWTFNSWGTASTPSYQSSGGNPGGFIGMTLVGSGSRGYWIQPFQVDGSTPYTANVRLDVEILGGLTLGRLIVSVDSSNSVPDPNTAIQVVSFSSPVPWTSLGRFSAALNDQPRITAPGLYYLKVAFIADSATSSVTVGLDNVRLAWTTDAAVYFYVPVPLPYPVYISQDRTLFLSYYALILAIIFLAGGAYAVLERREIRRVFMAPIDALGIRLRSRSAWIAIGQVWMAVTFFQLTLIFFLLLAGIEPTNPINLTPENTWVFLYDLANAGFYEEIVFRVLLLGLPMAIGSVIVRIMEVNRGTSGAGPGGAGRYIAGAWRYLIGGVLRRDSPKEALVAAWAFLLASSAIFGLAHMSSWGPWKIVPAMVAGLGFGYLFLRHGVGAAILAHFVNDYALSLAYEGVGGTGLEVILILLFYGLAIAGAGFLAWYAIEAWRHLEALIARFRPAHRAPTSSPPSQPLASAPASGYGSPPQPPFAMPSSGPPTEGWAPGPAGPPPGYSARDPGRIPRDYSPSYAAPPFGYPPVRFQCPHCGWVEARYDAGRFTCLRCNRSA